MHKPPSLKNRQAQIDKWNAAHPEGAGVTVVVTLDNGSDKETITRGPAWMLGGHSPVISLEDVSGAYALDRVKYRPAKASV